MMLQEPRVSLYIVLLIPIGSDWLRKDRVER